MNSLKSKRRVSDHGEVFTPEREVKAMINLVDQEAERIESRFLEPACGTGNFLVPILNRKLNTIGKRYKRNQLEFEFYSVLAVSSLYGIDLLEDNIYECRSRLLQEFKNSFKKDCIKSVEFILSKNIVQGDALTLKINSSFIVFSEWSFMNRMIKRRDFQFVELSPKEAPDMFDEVLISDLGKKAFIPKPIREYPLCHFLNLAETC